MKFSKLLCLVSFAAMLLPLSVQAQLIKGYGIKFGVNSTKALINTRPSGLARPEDLETQRRTGWNAAFFVEWLKSPVFSLVTQVEYAQRGFVEEWLPKIPEPPRPLRANSQLDFISLPMMVKWQYAKARVSPFVIFGPRVDFLVNRKVGHDEYTVATPDPLNRLRVSANSANARFFNGHALGGNVGLGLTSNKLLRIPFLIEMRYNFDFTDQSDIKEFIAKKNAIDVWLGIKF